jgi:hypothetical protein
MAFSVAFAIQMSGAGRRKLKAIGKIALTITTTAFLLPMAPAPVKAVTALRLAPALVQEAATCLHLTENIASSISYEDTQTVRLLAERFSYLPEENAFSRAGIADAKAFLSSHPTTVSLTKRLDQCKRDLAGAVVAYSWHSCGFGDGTISEQWSESEAEKFYALRQKLEAEGVTLESGSPYLHKEKVF